MVIFRVVSNHLILKFIHCFNEKNRKERKFYATDLMNLRYLFDGEVLLTPLKIGTVGGKILYFKSRSYREAFGIR